MEVIIFFVILPMGATFLFGGILMIVMLGVRALMTGGTPEMDDIDAGDRAYWAGMVIIPALTFLFSFSAIKPFLHAVIIPIGLAYFLVLLVGNALMRPKAK